MLGNPGARAEQMQHLLGMLEAAQAGLGQRIHADDRCPAPRRLLDELLPLVQEIQRLERGQVRQVEAQERKMLTLRDRIGNAKWCQLYSVEMQEAYIIVQSIMQRNAP